MVGKSETINTDTCSTSWKPYNKSTQWSFELCTSGSLMFELTGSQGVSLNGLGNLVSKSQAISDHFNFQSLFHSFFVWTNIDFCFWTVSFFTPWFFLCAAAEPTCDTEASNTMSFVKRSPSDPTCSVPLPITVGFHKKHWCLWTRPATRPQHHPLGPGNGIYPKSELPSSEYQAQIFKDYICVKVLWINHYSLYLRFEPRVLERIVHQCTTTWNTHRMTLYELPTFYVSLLKSAGYRGCSCHGQCWPSEGTT